MGCGYSDHLTARRFWVWIPWGPGYILCRGCMLSPCLWVLFGYSPKTCILGLGELVSRCPHSIMCGHIQTHSPQCSTYECVKQGLIWLKGLGGHLNSNTSPHTVLHVLKIMKRALQKNCDLCAVVMHISVYLDRGVLDEDGKTRSFSPQMLIYTQLSSGWNVKIQAFISEYDINKPEGKTSLEEGLHVRYPIFHMYLRCFTALACFKFGALKPCCSINYLQQAGPWF